MKFKIVTIFIALILFIAQPVNISKADLASDLLKKAQELAEKQKIKGKKLEAFILSNIITVDYEGKEQTYKFNKDITYNVYENSKVIGDGTWAIKGLTKSSIKLSGYRDIYFQIYSAKDRISTLTNLKKKNDGQTNRKILKISSLDDFEEQLANSKTKKEKKKVKKEEVKKKVKKEEVKKKVKKEEIRKNISVADINNKNDLSKYLIENGLVYINNDGSTAKFIFFQNGKGTHQNRIKKIGITWKVENKNIFRWQDTEFLKRGIGFASVTLDFDSDLINMVLSDGAKYMFKIK